MKNQKRTSFFLVGIVTLLTGFAANLTSCSYFTADPIEEYLNEYTNTAAVVSHTLDADYPTDKNGYINIPSDTDKSFDLIIRNPQKYKLVCTPVLVDSTAQAARSSVSATSTYGDPVTFIQDSSDTSLAKIKYTSEFLTAMEGGGDISTQLGLIGYTSDGIPLSFESNKYEGIVLKVNSTPEPVRNLVVLQDNSNSTYVVAMNMPDMSGIHKDIIKITINGTEYPVSYSAENPVGIDTETYSIFATDTSFTKDLGTGENGAAFDGAAMPRALYYKTNAPFQTDAYQVTVTLEDTCGLTTEAVVSTKSEKLGNVDTNGANLTALETGDDGYSRFTLSAASTSTAGNAINGTPTVYYIIYDTKKNILKQGSGSGSVSVSVAAGNWSIETWSHLAGYIDSETITENLKVEGYQYIDSTYTGSVSDGGMNTPFKTIEEALNVCRASSMTDVRLIIRNSMTVTNTVSVDSFNLLIRTEKLTINHTNTSESVFKLSDGHTLTLENTTTGNISGGNGCTVTLKNSTAGNITLGDSSVITGTGTTGNITAGNKAAVSITGNTGNITLGEKATAVLENSLISDTLALGKASTATFSGTSRAANVSLADDAVLLVKDLDTSALSDSQLIATVSVATPVLNKVIVKPAEGYKLTKELAARFVLNNPGYFSEFNETDGTIVIKVSGATTILPTVGGFKLSYSGIEGSDGQYTIAKANAASTTIGTSITKADGSSITPQTITMSLYMYDDLVASGTSSLTLPNNYIATYTLVTTFTYDNVTYSDTIILKVE